MKNILICGLFLSLLLTGCNNNDPTPVSGLESWVNQRNDTITFDTWSVFGKIFIYKNSNPRYHKFYSYNIQGDSIYLTDIASSHYPPIVNSYYYHHIGVDNIEMHKFKDLEIGIYKRINKK